MDKAQATRVIDDAVDRAASGDLVGYAASAAVAELASSWRDMVAADGYDMSGAYSDLAQLIQRLQEVQLVVLAANCGGSR